MAALLGGCGTTPAVAPERRLELQPCRLKGVAEQTLCGSLEVLEDRQASHGRRIALKVAVLPALAREPAPDPLFLLAGGPGQSITESAAALLPAFDRVRRQHDLVLVDQRGTGGSGALDCALYADDGPLLERFGGTAFPTARLTACLAAYKADPRQYTTAAAVADLDAVRTALGYAKIDLWGGSYGTRLALAYMREHPGQVRSAVLDGVAPYANRLPLYFARDGQRALEQLLSHCAQDAACASAFPDLKEHLRALLAQLRAAPIHTTVTHPLTGRSEPLTITADAFVGGLRGALYAPEVASLLPLAIESARRGDFSPFVALSLAFESSLHMSLGLFLSVVCTEDVPFIEPAEVEPASAHSFLGPGITREMQQACAVWPRGTLAAGARDPVRSDVPTLLLSGELDPATPPEWAELAAQTLTRSRHVVAPGVGHGVTSHGCVPELLARFVADPVPETLDTGCVKALARPPFFLTFAGPQP